jgi:tRNA(Arg) A34 adenosine deaminase TadA
MSEIKYPFEPKQGYKFVDLNNKYMQEAMKAAKEMAYDSGNETSTPIGGVFVKNGEIILKASNGSTYHKENGCERKKLGIVGKDYELCPGCSAKVHCEANAVRQAEEKHIDIYESDFYMFGHYWCCELCCKKLSKYNIKNYYLLEGASDLFDRNKETCQNGNWEYFKSLINKK